MKNINRLILVFLCCSITGSFAQSSVVLNYKVKTAANAAERTAILNAFRAGLRETWKVDFIFTVNYLSVAGNYACFMGSAERKDGKPMEFPDESYDCCNAEAVLKKVHGHWTVLEGHAFSTDVWWDGFNKRYPEVPIAVFPVNHGWVR